MSVKYFLKDWWAIIWRLVIFAVVFIFLIAGFAIRQADRDECRDLGGKPISVYFDTVCIGPDGRVIPL